MKETNVFRLLNVPSYVTTLGLAFGLTAMYFVMNGMPEVSVMCLYLAVWCDRLDGLIARKLNLTSDFGAELDNLSDAIAFGVAPGFFLYGATGNLWMLPFSFLLTFAVVLRLARYSYVGLLERDGKHYFVGLPAPYSAAVLFIVWAVIHNFDATVQNVVLAVYSVVLSILHMSTASIRKGSTFEKWGFYIIYPIVFLYLILSVLGLRLW